MNRTISLLLLAVPLAGCAGARTVAGTTSAPKEPLRLIAMVGPENEFALKFGQELSNRGYGILDPQKTRSLLKKLGIYADTLEENERALALLKDRRVDAVMRLTSEIRLFDRGDLLDKVHVKVNATDGGDTIGSIDWTNGSGGMSHSLLDNASRLSIPRAAAAVATELVKQLGAPGAKTTVLTDDLIAAPRTHLGAPALAAVPVAAPQPKSHSSDVDAPARRGPERPNDFALVIGVEEYQSLPKADFGARDAQVVRKHFEAMGVPARNIILLEGTQATGSKMRSYLQQWLPRNVKPESTVFVYYSGHGAPDPENGDAYLVPWDADPMFLATSAYPLKQFYAELAKLQAKRVIVALDACFSGSGGRSVLAKGARPLVSRVDESVPAAANLTVLAAASGGEITG